MARRICPNCTYHTSNLRARSGIKIQAHGQPPFGKTSIEKHEFPRLIFLRAGRRILAGGFLAEGPCAVHHQKSVAEYTEIGRRDGPTTDWEPGQRDARHLALRRYSGAITESEQPPLGVALPSCYYRLKGGDFVAQYTMIIHSTGDNFTAYCPDVPGCSVTGTTASEPATSICWSAREAS